MSGHSKWATIKHKKAATDAKRGKLFTRLIKEITIAARDGGDPDSNSRLRTAIATAKAGSMPQENIKRAIQRGTGEIDGGQLEEVMFEGYGPGGAAVLVMTVTDNRKRTVAEIRHIFGKYSGNLGEKNSVSFMFDRKSHVLIDVDKITEDELLEAVLDADPEDIRSDGSHWEVLAAPEQHHAVVEALAAAGIETVGAEIGMLPQTLVKLEGKQAQQMLKLHDMLEEQDDVQNIYSNFDIDEKELESLTK
ncbi:MAG: YebC/PmpR family DNA-binding transcriptional regulator [bacterium]|nr:YebC/PmpR family DNA-binding transcriptional regulator [bacterium]